MQQIATGLKEHSLVKVQLILFQLCCFFLPKVYAVVCKPDKRQRKPQTSRARKYETPPHSVAVGFADGALLGDVTRYNIQGPQCCKTFLSSVPLCLVQSKFQLMTMPCCVKSVTFHYIIPTPTLVAFLRVANTLTSTIKKLLTNILVKLQI